MAEAKNEIQKKQTTELAAGSFDYGNEAGGGFENTTAADLSVPFITVLQSLSPQVEEKNPPGSEPGKLFNTVTRELHDGEKGIAFIPCHKDHCFVEWVPRKKGGGFVAVHAVDSQMVKEAIERNGGSRVGKLVVSDEVDCNELIETHYVYGLLLDAEGNQPEGFAVISFTSTKIKPVRDWMTALYTLKGKPPMFANRARIRSVKQKNEHGTFHNFQVEPLRETWLASLINPVEEAELLNAAREFREQVTSGIARAAFETQDPAGAAEGKAAF